MSAHNQVGFLLSVDAMHEFLNTIHKKAMQSDFGETAC